MGNVFLPSLPRDKHDTANATALVAASWEIIEPVMPRILEWMQDLNWPAKVLAPRTQQYYPGKFHGN